MTFSLITQKLVYSPIKSNDSSTREYPHGKTGLLFVGVITAEKYMETRAKSSYLTWGKSVPGKIFFFTKSNSTNIANLPIIKLPEIDDSYPPQKKSFRMLKFMYENYLDKFGWFLRADDDVYIKMDKLEEFLRNLNSSKHLYIGQPGFGVKSEFGKLNLSHNECFCMGGPGIIISRETLRTIGPYLDFCFNHLIFTYHEDVEVGRCINKFVNITCTVNYEVSKQV